MGPSVYHRWGALGETRLCMRGNLKGKVARRTSSIPRLGRVGRVELPGSLLPVAVRASDREE